MDEDDHGIVRRRAASLGRSGELALDVFDASYESRVSFIPRARMLSDALTDPVRSTVERWYISPIHMCE